MSKDATAGSFKKGDPRINRKGRPRHFEALRDVTLDMFSRQAKDANGTPILIEGKPVTMIEFVMWKMIRSKDPREVQYAVQVAFGKVPDALELSGKEGKEITLKVVYDTASRVQNPSTEPTPEATEIHQQPGEAQDHPGG